MKMADKKHNCENCIHKAVCALWEIQTGLDDSDCGYYQSTEPQTVGDYVRSFDDPKLARYLAETTGLAILAVRESYGKTLSQKDKNDILDKLTEEYLHGLSTPLEG